MGKGEECFVIETRDPVTALVYDLELATYFDTLLHERLPVTYNHLLSTGYFTTPSARMSCPGVLGIGGGSVPPYIHINALIQLFSHLEVTANYRIFRNIEDPGLSKEGFGDFADRGANIKIALFTPEDSDNILPGVAFGVEDFMGTKAFNNIFLTSTKVWVDLGLEASLGLGWGRYTRGPSNGFFGGVSWFPFWKPSYPFLSGLALVAEYDPIDYKNPHREPHPKGRKTSIPINFGLKYQWEEFFFLSASCIRGEACAINAGMTYNFGEFKGFLPKLKDPLFYHAPIVTEPLGMERPESAMIQHLGFVFQNQGFLMTEAWIETSSFQDCRLWLRVVNNTYREEHCIRQRIEHILAALLPSNISCVIVILESHALSCHQYVYPRELLYLNREKKIGDAEFEMLTLRQEAQSPPDHSRRIFLNPLELWRVRFSPRFETFFGNAKGKFKYDVGVKADLEGFLPLDIFYEFQCSTTIFSSLQNISDFDRYNPSQLPNVNTDYVLYRQKRSFSTDKAYFQKSWNLSHGLFGRGSLGYFQVNYAGVAGELLYYPAHSLFAVGLEGAILKKRRYTGLGFQNRLRRLKGYTPTYFTYTTLQQYFLNLYFDFPEISVASKVSIGQFLAQDKGAKFEVVRYFKNGLRIKGWITYTNAGDKMHGENYYDRGIAVEFPFDFFYKCSSKRIFSYGLAAWLRDAGAASSTGKSLFEIINLERR